MAALLNTFIKKHSHKYRLLFGTLLEKNFSHNYEKNFLTATKNIFIHLLRFRTLLYKKNFFHNYKKGFFITIKNISHNYKKIFLATIKTFSSQL